MVWDYIVSFFEYIIGWLQEAFEETKEAFNPGNWELNWFALIFTIVGSVVFILMIWKIPTWNSYPFIYKVFISGLLPIVTYPLVLKKLS